MADEKEKVLYEFQGDVSSLKTATQLSLKMLDKFQERMNQLNADGMIKAGQRVQAGINASVNKSKKAIGALQVKLRSVGDVKMPRGGEAFNTMSSATKNLLGTLNRLSTSENVTAKDMRIMREAINSTTGSVKASVPAFESIIASEQRFQEKLEVISNKTKAFKETLVNATAPVLEKFNTMGAKMDPLITKMQGLKDKATIVGQRVSQVFTTVADAFRRTSDGATDASASQSKLGSFISKVAQKFSQLKSSEEKSDEELKKNTNNVRNASSNFKSFGNTIKNVVSKIGDFSKKLGSMCSSLVQTTGLSQALSGVLVGLSLGEATKGAINYVENLNLFTVAMGDSIDMGKEFVAQMQEVYGMDPSNLYRYAGNFYQLTDAIGMCDKASATISLSLTKAANDLSSLFNTDIETVVSDLTSGMQGMARTVRKYGMDIRNVTLEETARKIGMKGNVDEMSEANRQALRYITMLDQAKNAVKQHTDALEDGTDVVGDFARNIETPANQLRIFKEQITQLGRAIGTFLAAPLARVLPYINGFIMALRTAITFVSTLLNIVVQSGNSLSGVGDGADDASDGIDGVGDSAKQAAKDLAKLNAPFDELNVIADEAAGASGIDSEDYLDPKLAQALEDMQLGLENIQMKANKIRDTLLKTFGFTVDADGSVVWSKDIFKNSLIKMFPTWSSEINEAFSSWDASGFGQLAGTIISASLEKFGEFISWENIGATITGVITTLHTFINSAISNLDGTVIGTTLGETLNTIIQTSLLFITGFDWSSVGTLIAETINGACTTIDWSGVGQWLAALPNAIFQALSSLVTNLDWTTLGSNIGTTIETLFASLDYNAFMSTIVNSLIGAMEMLNELIPSLLEAGASLLNGLAQGFEDNFPTFIDKLPGLIQGLVDGITESLPKFTEAALNLITTLANGIIDALPTLIASIPVIIEGLIDTILESAPQIMDAGVQLITKLFDNFDDIIVPLINAIGNIIGQLIGAILALIPDIARTGVELLVSLVGSIPEIVVALVAALPALITGLIEGLLAHIPEIAESGIKLLGSLVMSIPEIIWELVKAVPDIIKGLVQAFTSKESMGDIGEAGKDLIKGLWDGIKDAGKWLKDKISGFVDGVIGDIKSFFGIHSPSKETYWMGEMLTQGLADAIEDTSKVAVRATEAMSDKIDGALGNITTGVENAQRSLGSMNTKVNTQVGTYVTSIVDPTRTSIGGLSTGDTNVTDGTDVLLQRLVDILDKDDPNNAGGSDQGAIEVRVFIGDKEYDAYTYKAAERGKKIVGKQPVKIGG